MLNSTIFTHMVEYKNEQKLSDILKAASDPTRRSILTMLVQQGALRVTELAGHYDMSLNSISKHIKVLEKAGLVSRKTVGRVHLIEAELEPIAEIETWFKSLKSIWALRLESLDELIGLPAKGDKNERINIKH
ncbi:MAG: metalloregulator ArsR/SmtB family transcription factor [Hyphomicrobiales bacterium]